MEATTVINSFNPPPPVSGKKIQMTVAWYFHDYKVISITNTTSLKPGMWLLPSVVEKCAQAADWEVTVVDNDVVSHIFDALGALSRK